MKNIALFALAAGFAALTGCTTNVNTVERASPQAQPNYVADKRVVTDASLSGALRVNSVNQAVVSGNLLKVQAQLENLKSSVRAFNYRIEWYDQDGMLVSSPTEGWKLVRLQGRETTSISAVAISPRAVDFVLKLQEAN